MQQPLALLTPSPILAMSSGNTLSTAFDASALANLCLGIHLSRMSLSRAMVALKTCSGAEM